MTRSVDIIVIAYVNWRIMSQQSQQSRVATVVVELAEIKFANRRVYEANSEGTDGRAGIVSFHQ